MARFKHGDIFAVQLPNQRYLFGRILLNVKERCVKPKLLEPGSPLTFFGGSLLVEMYRAMSVTPEEYCAEQQRIFEQDMAAGNVPPILVGP